MSIDHGKLLALIIDEVRAMKPPADIVGGAEQYGFQRAIDSVVRKLRALAQPAEAVEVDGDRHWSLSPPEPANDAAQGAVAEVYAGAFGIHYIACADPNKLPVGTKLYTRPQAAPAQAGWLHASIIREAGDVLEAVGASGVSLPDNWRWPLADELHGIAAMTAAPAQGVPEGWRIVREANGDLTLEKDGIAPYIRQRFHARHMLHGFLSAMLAAASLQEPQS